VRIGEVNKHIYYAELAANSGTAQDDRTLGTVREQFGLLHTDFPKALQWLPRYPSPIPLAKERVGEPWGCPNGQDGLGKSTFIYSTNNHKQHEILAILQIKSI